MGSSHLYRQVILILSMDSDPADGFLSLFECEKLRYLSKSHASWAIVFI